MDSIKISEYESRKLEEWQEKIRKTIKEAVWAKKIDTILVETK